MSDPERKTTGMTIRGALVLLTLLLLAIRWPWPAVISVDVVVYATWAYNHPWRTCWACRGARRNSWSTRWRWGKCWRCRGTGELTTLGARLLRLVVRRLRTQVSEWRNG
jgi:hypothetical protein